MPGIPSLFSVASTSAALTGAKAGAAAASGMASLQDVFFLTGSGLGFYAGLGIAAVAGALATPLHASYDIARKRLEAKLREEGRDPAELQKFRDREYRYHLIPQGAALGLGALALMAVGNHFPEAGVMFLGAMAAVQIAAGEISSYAARRVADKAPKFVTTNDKLRTRDRWHDRVRSACARTERLAATWNKNKKYLACPEDANLQDLKFLSDTAAQILGQICECSYAHELESLDKEMELQLKRCDEIAASCAKAMERAFEKWHAGAKHKRCLAELKAALTGEEVKVRKKTTADPQAAQRQAATKVIVKIPRIR